MNYFYLARRSARVSQTSVGEFAEISRQSVSALEKVGRNPRSEELKRLSSFYRVRPEALIDGWAVAIPPEPPADKNYRASHLGDLDRLELGRCADALNEWRRPHGVPHVPGAMAMLPASCNWLRSRLGQADMNFDPFRALYQHGVLVEFTALDGLHGAILWDRERKRCAVVISSEQVDDRLRWTAAHELAHVALQHESRDDKHHDPFGTPATPEDREADRMAAELLMPLAPLSRDASELSAGEDLDEQLYRLAVKYQVSYAAMVVRLCGLGWLSPARAEQLRKSKPTAIEAKLNLRSGGIRFDAHAALPAIVRTLCAEGDLPAGWERDFEPTSGPMHLRRLQGRAVQDYILALPTEKRADSINAVFQKVARWLAEQHGWQRR